MKKLKNTILLLFVFATISCSKSNAQKSAFSEEALAEKVLNTNGSEIAFKNILAQNKGKNLVIKVWATWCRDCVKEMPRMKELQESHPETNYVYISMDDNAEKWKNGIERYQLKGQHYMAKDQMKGVFAKAIDLDWIPRCIVIDKKGKIVIYRAVETDFEKVNATLDRLEKETI
ncbi:TlpA family protein disulfide reductase [Flavobacterium flavipallidum]|uniref:TlpA disulfide reductase family protein n=1 Tax=Flavobacterium flavipallidum TaxID=3139140 RepID=A0ABU9HKW0_9FLAO